MSVLMVPFVNFRHKILTVSSVLCKNLKMVMMAMTVHCGDDDDDDIDQ